MHIVREMKKFGDISVANVMTGFGWKWTKKRPTSIDKMVEGLPRCELVRILNKLKSR